MKQKNITPTVVMTKPAGSMGRSPYTHQSHINKLPVIRRKADRNAIPQIVASAAKYCKRKIMHLETRTASNTARRRPSQELARAEAPTWMRNKWWRLIHLHICNCMSAFFG
jgi:hypothetical protein